MKKIISIFLVLIVHAMYSSEHNHNRVHSQQLESICHLGKKFDQEVIKAENGLSYNFIEIFAQMNRLSASMVCPTCQTTYRAIIHHHIETTIPEIQLKLAFRQLPIIDLEPSDHV